MVKSMNRLKSQQPRSQSVLKRITIDGEVGREDGQVSASWVKSQLPTNGIDPIEVCIHSEGGSVIEGFAIYDALKAYAGPKRCIISSSAFSISSFIPMAFDDVEITPNGYLMMHKPYMGCEGDDVEFAKRSTLLTDMTTNMVNAYAMKTGKSIDEIKAILANETYMNATTALANGFVNRITPTPVMGRVFAKVKTMPHGIVQALFGAVLVAITENRQRKNLCQNLKPPSLLRSNKSKQRIRRLSLTSLSSAWRQQCRCHKLPRRPMPR